MRKLYVKRLRRSWTWWYIAVGDWQPFKRFGHGGFICLSLAWFKRFWNYDGAHGGCAKKGSV